MLTLHCPSLKRALPRRPPNRKLPGEELAGSGRSSRRRRRSPKLLRPLNPADGPYQNDTHHQPGQELPCARTVAQYLASDKTATSLPFAVCTNETTQAGSARPQASTNAALTGVLAEQGITIRDGLFFGNPRPAHRRQPRGRRTHATGLPLPHAASAIMVPLATPPADHSFTEHPLPAFDNDWCAYGSRN